MAVDYGWVGGGIYYIIYREWELGIMGMGWRRRVPYGTIQWAAVMMMMMRRRRRTMIVMQKSTKRQ